MKNTHKLFGTVCHSTRCHEWNPVPGNLILHRRGMFKPIP